MAGESLSTWWHKYNDVLNLRNQLIYGIISSNRGEDYAKKKPIYGHPHY